MKKTEDPALQRLHLQMMPDTGHTLTFGHDFMLTDNFGLPVDEETLRRFVAAAHPFKIAFTLVMFCTEGAMRVQLNLQEYRLEAGHVLVVLPGDIGKCLEFGADCRMAIIAYSDAQYTDGGHSATAFTFRQYLSKQRILPLPPDEMDELLGIYGRMRRRMEQPDYGFTREVLRSYMQLLMNIGFQWLSRYGKQQTADREVSRAQELLDRFLDLVQQHAGRERSITFYADRLCLTPKYLSTVVYHASGRHAGEWIKDYVLLEAKALLRSRQYTVQQVSELLGFPNTSFFGKYFKAAVGCTPRTYMLGGEGSR